MRRAAAFVGRAVARLLGRRAMGEWPDPALEKRLLESLPRLAERLSLHVFRYREPEGRGVRLRVGGVCPALSIGPYGGGHTDLGDPRLDNHVYCAGPTALVRAVMDRTARSRLAELLGHPAVRKGSLRVDGGTLSVDVQWKRHEGEDDLVREIAQRASVTAHLLHEPTSLRRRLGQHALHDPEPAVRLANLATLLHDFPGERKTLAVLREALTRPDPQVRLAAAVALGAEGRPALEELARRAPDSCAAAAIEALGALPREELREILGRALEPAPGRNTPARPTSARACVEQLAGARDEEAVELLARAAAADHTAVAMAAVRALARVGGLGVLPALQEAARAHPDEEVLGAARSALADLKDDLGGAPGQLSLSGASSGDLTLADDGGGRVSLAGRPRART